MNSPNKMKNQLLFCLSSISAIHRRWHFNFSPIWRFEQTITLTYDMPWCALSNIQSPVNPSFHSTCAQDPIHNGMKASWFAFSDGCETASLLASLYLLKIISHGLSISHRFMPFLLLPYLTSSLFAYMILRNDMKILGEGYRLSSLLTLRALFASQTLRQRERKTKCGGRRAEKVLNCQFSIEIRSCVKLSPVTGPVECRFFLNF